MLEPENIALLIAVLAGFLPPFDLSAVNITLPTIASEFSMDAVTLDWVATVCLLASTVFLVPFGGIAETTKMLHEIVALADWGGNKENIKIFTELCI
jgi:MFS family permease